MKVINLEITLPEADVLFRALQVIDPHNIFIVSLKQKIQDAAQAVADEKKESKE